MTDLRKGLQAYAAHVDAVEPVTAQEARDRADLPAYSSECVMTLMPPRRHRRAFIVAAVAAVIVACLVGVSTWNVTRPQPTTTPSPTPFFLPATVPAGLHLTYKPTSKPNHYDQRLAVLAPDGDRRGWIEVVATPTLAFTVEAADFSDPVHINGSVGMISVPPGQPMIITWTHGGRLYSVSGVGAETEELLAVARSVGYGGEAHSVAGPPGWSTLPVPLPDPVVTLAYAGDGIGLARISVYADGGEIVDQIADAMPGATIAGRGDQVVVMTEWGTEERVYREVGDSGYAMAVVSDLPDMATTALVGSITQVASEAWEAAPVEAVGLYQPDPAAYAPVVTTPTVQLEGQPGPSNSWCLRTAPPPADLGSECLRATNAGSVRVTDIAGTPTASRAVYGTSDRKPRDILVTLDDRSRVEATLAPLPGTDLTAWIATLPADRRVRSIEALDNTSRVMWHAGP